MLFRSVLKRFGPGNPAPLSFPIPGWTLAADVPAGVPGLLELLDKLDEELVRAGGRIYLAKDSRQSGRVVQACYPQFENWCRAYCQTNSEYLFASCMLNRICYSDQASWEDNHLGY